MIRPKCKRTRVRKNNPIHNGLIQFLENGTVIFTVRDHIDRSLTYKVSTTLVENIIPNAKKGDLRRTTANLEKRDFILAWATNRNYNSPTMEREAGWVEIPLELISGYEFVGTIDATV